MTLGESKGGIANERALIMVRLLDIYSTVDLKRLQSIDLESSNDVASSSKAIQLSPFWFWRTLHAAQLNNVSRPPK